MEGIGQKFTPVIGRHLLCHLSMFGSKAGTSWTQESPNSSDAEGLTHLWLPTLPPTPYNMPSVILQWF